MISSDIMRGYHDILVLSLLMKGDSYGYEISKQIRECSNGDYVIKETTLYATFNRLEKNMYVTSYVGSETFGRTRTYYKITNSGRNYYLEKCDEWRMTRKIINCFTGGEN